jgi:hypothetical protein
MRGKEVRLARFITKGFLISQKRFLINAIDIEEVTKTLRLAKGTNGRGALAEQIREVTLCYVAEGLFPDCWHLYIVPNRIILDPVNQWSLLRRIQLDAIYKS